MNKLAEIEKQNLLTTLEMSLGVVTTACAKAGISRATYYNWYDSDIEFKERVDAIQDVVLDFAESQLHQNISKGDTASILFYLKCKGKKRGYIERIESHNLNLNVNVDGDFSQLSENDKQAKLEHLRRCLE